MNGVCRLLDWFLQLPEDLEAEYHAELHELEEAYKMPYVTSFERAGIEKGRQEGRREEGSELLLLQLQDKFGSEAAERYRQQVEQADETMIRTWSIRFVRAETIEDIFTDG